MLHGIGLRAIGLQDWTASDPESNDVFNIEKETKHKNRVINETAFRLWWVTSSISVRAGRLRRDS